MRCNPRRRWSVVLSATLALGLPPVSMSAGPRGASPSQAHHASGHGVPTWQRPGGPGWGGNPGWAFGHGHRWDFAGAWRERICEGLREELSQDHRSDWRRGHLWFLLLGCAGPDPDPVPVPDPLAPPPDHTLRDASGAALADLGSVALDQDVIRVPFASAFADPVVILGPATAHEADPGVAQVLDVDAEGFRVRFAEWAYLDGVHAAEAVSYLVLAAGRHALPDGSEWEAGFMELSGTGAWDAMSFSAAFDAPPLVFLTVQTSNEDEPVLVRAREVTPFGFQAALFEAEGDDGARGVERVGYLAVESPRGSGRIEAAGGSMPYLMRRVVADHRRVPVLSSALWLEEEASLDDELEHADETLAFLAIGAKVFAQDVSSGDLDPVGVRREAPEYAPVLEWGTLSGVDGAWHTVPLAREYTDPVVVVGPLSSDDAAPGVVRIRDAGPDAFQVRVQSWQYIGRDHGPERVFYLVADPGIQSLAGLVVEAGHLDSSLVLPSGQETIAFPLPYADVPGVFASVMTENGTQPVTVRVAGRTGDGFRMALQPEEAYAGGLPGETLGWIAVQSGRGVTGDGRVVSVFDAGVDHTPVPVTFGETLRGRFPTVVARISSALGLDPVVLRYLNLTPDAVTLRLEEEQSASQETNHLVEDVSLFVAE